MVDHSHLAVGRDHIRQEGLVQEAPHSTEHKLTVDRDHELNEAPVLQMKIVANRPFVGQVRLGSDPLDLLA